MIGDYPDLLAELHESTRVARDAKSEARIACGAAVAAVEVLMTAVQDAYSSACDRADRRDSITYAHIHARAGLRDEAKKNE